MWWLTHGLAFAFGGIVGAFTILCMAAAAEAVLEDRASRRREEVDKAARDANNARLMANARH